MNIDEPQINQVSALRGLWQEAFGDTDEFLNAFFKTAFSSNRCRCVTADGQVVAALYWFDCLHMDKQVAYIYAVATSIAYRGQGICHKLMEDTHLHLTRLGYEGAILVPGNQELFRLYESIGYQTCSHIREFCCIGAADEVNLYPIDKTEYARLRRLLLPKGSVIQENENLDFLQTQVNFYMGFGFLLAAYGKADTLYGVELLGDVTMTSEIVQSLGYTKGRFRIPKDGIPFAMYQPLGNSKLPAPRYFGFAFD